MHHQRRNKFKDVIWKRIAWMEESRARHVQFRLRFTKAKLRKRRLKRQKRVEESGPRGGAENRNSQGGSEGSEKEGGTPKARNNSHCPHCLPVKPSFLRASACPFLERIPSRTRVLAASE